MNRTEFHIYRMLLAPVMLALAPCLANAQNAIEIKQWQVYEIEMSATRNEANPHVAYLPEAGRVSDLELKTNRSMAL